MAGMNWRRGFFPTAMWFTLLALTGCGTFSGTRQDYPWAQEYNYLQGQRISPEQLGILITNRGPYSVVVWPQTVSGEDRVTVPLHLQGGAMTTPVGVNGTKRVPAVIDTGAPFNLSSLTLAYNLDLPVTRPKTLPQTVHGYGGAGTECGWSLLKSLQIGGMTYSNALVMIPLEKFDRVTFFGFVTLNHDEFLILGLDDMTRMSFATLDFPKEQLVLARQTPYQPKPNGDAIFVPCQINPGPTLTTMIRVDGKGPFSCRIDTGKTYTAPALTIPQKLAQELGYWKEGGGRRSNQLGFGGSFESQRFKLKSFEIGGRNFPNLSADSHAGAAEFILGAAFFRQYRMTIDFRGRMIYLEK